MRRAWLGLAALPVLAVLGLAGLRWHEARQHAAFRDLPALPLPDPVLPADGRAWQHLQTAIDLALLDQAGQLGAALESSGRPSEPITALWLPQERALAEVQAALARPGLSLPSADLLGGEEPPRYIELVVLARASALRGWDEEQPDLALQHLALPLHLGQRLLDADGDLMPAMVGLAIRDIGAVELAEYVDSQPLAAGSRAALLAELQPYARRPPAVPAALIRECHSTEQLFHRLGQEPGLFDRVGSPGTKLAPWLLGLVYDADTTAGWQRAWCMALLDAAAGGGPLPDSPVEIVRPQGPSRLRQALYNPVGWVLIDTASPSFGRFFEQEAASRDRLDALLAALRD